MKMDLHDMGGVYLSLDDRTAQPVWDMHRAEMLERNGFHEVSGPRLLFWVVV